ncbi:MAG: hypothetical protein LBI63_00970 [Candidatus Ancillula sp.]|jgi:hypothetical protein|nr:hypothetical protein [Candidatus Ancillula sp.]
MKKMIIFRHIKLLPLLVFLAVEISLVALLYDGFSSWPILTWAKFDSVVREASWIPGLFTLILVNISASKASKSSVIAPYNSGLSLKNRYISLILPISVFATISYFIGLIPLLCNVAITDHYGFLNIFNVIVVVIVIFTWGLIGYIVKTIFDSKWSVLLTLLLFALVNYKLSPFTPSILTDPSHKSISFVSLLPTWGNGFPYVGYTLTNSIQIFRIVFFMSIFCCLYFYFSSWMSKTKTDRINAVKKQITVFLVPIFLAVFAFIYQPYLVVKNVNMPTICKIGKHQEKICVLGSEEKIIPYVEKASDRFFDYMEIADGSNVNLLGEEVDFDNIERRDKTLEFYYSSGTHDYSFVNQTFIYFVNQISGQNCFYKDLDPSKYDPNKYSIYDNFINDIMQFYTPPEEENSSSRKSREEGDRFKGYSKEQLLEYFHEHSEQLYKCEMES